MRQPPKTREAYIKKGQKSIFCRFRPQNIPEFGSKFRNFENSGILRPLCKILNLFWSTHQVSSPNSQWLMRQPPKYSIGPFLSDGEHIPCFPFPPNPPSFSEHLSGIYVICYTSTYVNIMYILQINNIVCVYICLLITY